jgi:tRNA (adenine22-N1)-methyltransferase
LKLSDRLQGVAKLVGMHRRLADIGSDHAGLPIWMLQEAKIDFAVAGEVKPGPLTAARLAVRTAGMEERIAVRLGDGLRVVSPGEVEVAVMAGMGWNTMKEILETSPSVVKTLQRLVFQPMTGVEKLRVWLMEHKWRLLAENLVSEEGRLYVMLAAEPSLRSEPYDPLLLEIGPLLWEQRHPLLPEYLQQLRGHYVRRRAEMEKSNDPLVTKRRFDCGEKIKALEEKMQWL